MRLEAVVGSQRGPVYVLPELRSSATRQEQTDAFRVTLPHGPQPGHDGEARQRQVLLSDRWCWAQYTAASLTTAAAV